MRKTKDAAKNKKDVSLTFRAFLFFRVFVMRFLKLKTTNIQHGPCGGNIMSSNTIDLSVEFCGRKFINPFLLSSSPVSNSAEMVSRAFEAGWSGAVYKTLNSDRLPIVHPSPRMHSYPYGSKGMVAVQNVEQISDRPLKDNLIDMLYLKKKHPQHAQRSCRK